MSSSISFAHSGAPFTVIVEVAAVLSAARARGPSLIDKRSHARHPIAIDVELLDGADTHAGQTRDLSLGGMFICTSAKLSFGANVSVRVRLPALEDAAVLEATVRWQTREGIGVCFRSLRARHVWALNSLLKEAGFFT